MCIFIHWWNTKIQTKVLSIESMNEWQMETGTKSQIHANTRTYTYWYDGSYQVKFTFQFPWNGIKHFGLELIKGGRMKNKIERKFTLRSWIYTKCAKYIQINTIFKIAAPFRINALVYFNVFFFIQFIHFQNNKYSKNIPFLPRYIQPNAYILIHDNILIQSLKCFYIIRNSLNNNFRLFSSIFPFN